MEINFRGESIFAGTGRQPLHRDQQTVVFVHGAGMDHTVWLFYERYLAGNKFNVLSIDLPGHGRSSGAPLASIEAASEWLGELLAHLEIVDAIVIGHSMGSLIAFECAANYPSRVAKTVLLGFSYPMTVGPPLLDAAKNNDPAAVDMMVIYGHDVRCQIGGNPVPGTSVINTAKRLLEKNKPGVLFADLSACNGYANGEIAAQKLTCPAIFISGDRDKMTSPRAAQAMSMQVANGTMATVADSGHGVMAEQPELTHQLLLDALTA